MTTLKEQSLQGTVLKINVMFAEYCYCHIRHVSPLVSQMLFGCQHFLCLQGIPSLHCGVYTQHSLRSLAHSCTVSVLKIAKARYYLKAPGNGRDQHWLLRIKYCGVWCYTCEMYTLTSEFLSVAVLGITGPFQMAPPCPVLWKMTVVFAAPGGKRL